MGILKQPAFHYVLFALALLGHGGTWLLCRVIYVYPGALVYSGILYLIALSLNTFVLFTLSDLYFAKPENRGSQWLYFIFPVISAAICILMATVFRAHLDEKSSTETPNVSVRSE